MVVAEVRRYPRQQEHQQEDTKEPQPRLSGDMAGSHDWRDHLSNHAIRSAHVNSVLLVVISGESGLVIRLTCADARRRASDNDSYHRSEENTSRPVDQAKPNQRRDNANNKAAGRSEYV